ncbi:MAG: ATP-binding cassette domain-containing protein [Spirochaetota bacterium]
MSQSDSVILRMHNLTRRFGGFCAIDDITMEIEMGELRAIVGPNGAGKTTLFNLITANLKPDRGKIFFKKHEITNLPPEKICRLGISRKFQSPSVFGNLTVLQNILVAGYGKFKIAHMLFGKIEKSDIDQAVEILNTIKLEQKKDELAGSLSHGERQWLEIGMILRTEPEILLLDEPTAGMTPSETIETAHLIRNISSELTTIVIEHDLKFLREIGEKVTVLHNGKILAEGTFEEIERDKQVKKVYIGRE